MTVLLLLLLLAHHLSRRQESGSIGRCQSKYGDWQDQPFKRMQNLDVRSAPRVRAHSLRTLSRANTGKVSINRQALTQLSASIRNKILAYQVDHLSTV